MSFLLYENKIATVWTVSAPKSGIPIKFKEFALPMSSVNFAKQPNWIRRHRKCSFFSNPQQFTYKMYLFASWERSPNEENNAYFKPVSRNDL